MIFSLYSLWKSGNPQKTKYICNYERKNVNVMLRYR
nr:MAG TPA: hypothetical protein [Caudoviricetes sp.]